MDFQFRRFESRYCDPVYSVGGSANVVVNDLIPQLPFSLTSTRTSTSEPVTESGKAAISPDNMAAAGPQF